MLYIMPQRPCFLPPSPPHSPYTTVLHIFDLHTLCRLAFSFYPCNKNFIFFSCFVTNNTDILFLFLFFISLYIYIFIYLKVIVVMLLHARVMLLCLLFYVSSVITLLMLLLCIKRTCVISKLDVGMCVYVNKRR